MDTKKIVDAVTNWKPKRPSKTNTTDAFCEGKTPVRIREIIEDHLNSNTKEENAWHTGNTKKKAHK
jgi:hypothetical protein